jgi:hypothetical protein
MGDETATLKGADGFAVRQGAGCDRFRRVRRLWRRIARGAKRTEWSRISGFHFDGALAEPNRVESKTSHLADALGGGVVIQAIV